MRTLTHIGDMPIATFLSEYWQKKPLLIRNAIAIPDSLPDANELAGFSLEDDTNARLVIETDHWQVKHGPLTEADFGALPDHNWSLLVQHADMLDPEINKLLRYFRFLPNWRLDDIMVSYASDNGGVGPHFDYYDVFLLQAAGKRRWRIGQHCDNHSPLIPDQPMKLLAQFDTIHDWIVEPGDLLYIPAQVAHWGEAINESTTYSIGFRSPSDNELLLDFTQNLSAELNEDLRFRDGPLSATAAPGEISPAAINALQTKLCQLVNNPQALSQWLGQYSTQLKAGVEPSDLPLAFISAETWLAGEAAMLSTFSRAAFAKLASTFDKNPTDTGVPTYTNTTEAIPADCELFINGDSYRTSVALADKLSGYQAIYAEQLSENEKTLMLSLIDQQLIVSV